MLKGLIGFLGRLLISLVFLAGGISKILDWQTTEQAVFTALADWLNYSMEIGWLHNIVEMAIPMIPALLMGAVILELLGGLCILLGIQVRFGAFLLVVFLIPATLLMHPFWILQGPMQEAQIGLFLKNLSILGGLLFLLAHGKDGKTKEKDGKGE
jgi:putative oxidoreductase